VSRFRTWILWRYILREHAGPFVFSLSIITLVFLLNLVFRELGRFLSRGLEFKVIAEFFFLNIAWIVALAIPMAVLVSTVMAFGRLSGDQEIVAMKSNGIGIPQMMTPIILASILLSVFLMWFNNAILPDFNHRTRVLAANITQKRPTLSLEPGVFFHGLPNYGIMVQTIREQPDTSIVKNVFIEDNSDANRVKTIVADSGKIYVNKQRGRLVFILYDGYLHELDLSDMENYRLLDFPKQIVSIPIPNWQTNTKQSVHRGDREKSAQEMIKEVRQNRQDIQKEMQRLKNIIDNQLWVYLPPSLRSDSSQTKYWERAGKRFPTPLRIERDHRQLKKNLQGTLHLVRSLKRQNDKLLVEVHKKYSIPVACLVFVLVGAPLGIMMRKGSPAMAVGVSFAFFLLYWASLIGGEELADNQFISPPVAMWAANVIVGLGGLYLVYHSIQESTFIDWTSLRQKFKRKSRTSTLSRSDL
jgi:lipopolysaccharide export system permease protein